MSQPTNRIVAGSLFFLAICLIAVIGYRLAGWSLLESIYMVTITVYGVGYGEVRAISDPGLKIFTIFIIIAGCTSAIYVFGGFVQLLVEGELRRYVGARKMTQEIGRTSNHVIVCGYGRVGRILTRQLCDSGTPFVVVDAEPERIQQAVEQKFLVVEGSATDEQTLLEAGVSRAKILATVLLDDALNVFVTLTAIDLNPDLYVIARAENPATEKKLIKSGARQVVLPAAIGAHRIASLINQPGMDELREGGSTFLQLSDELRQVGLVLKEITLEENSPLVKSAVSEVRSSTGGSVIVMAIKRIDGTEIEHPTPREILQNGDVLILLGQPDDLKQLTRQAKSTSSQLKYRGAAVS